MKVSMQLRVRSVSLLSRVDGAWTKGLRETLCRVSRLETYTALGYFPRCTRDFLELYIFAYSAINVAVCALAAASPVYGAQLSEYGMRVHCPVV